VPLGNPRLRLRAHLTMAAAGTLADVRRQLDEVVESPHDECTAELANSLIVLLIKLEEQFAVPPAHDAALLVDIAEVARRLVEVNNHTTSIVKAAGMDKTIKALASRIKTLSDQIDVITGRVTDLQRANKALDLKLDALTKQPQTEKERRILISVAVDALETAVLQGADLPDEMFDGSTAPRVRNFATFNEWLKLHCTTTGAVISLSARVDAAKRSRGLTDVMLDRGGSLWLVRQLGSDAAHAAEPPSPDDLVVLLRTELQAPVQVEVNRKPHMVSATDGEVLAKLYRAVML
jgi:hypothetical protein